MVTEEVLGVIVVGEDEVTLLRTRYVAGANAIIARLSDGAPYGTLSVNPGLEFALGQDEVAIKTWAENASWWPLVAASGLVQPTERVLDLGRVQAPVWRIIERELGRQDYS